MAQVVCGTAESAIGTLDNDLGNMSNDVDVNEKNFSEWTVEEVIDHVLKYLKAANLSSMMHLFFYSRR